jgi:hypothetical protein
MERFVFVAAVTIAIIWGAVAMFGHGRFIHFSGGDWDIDADARMAPLVEVAPGSLAAQTYVGSELDFEHLAANVVITPEDRADYVIEIANPAGRVPMPQITVQGGRITIDGQLSRRIEHCTDGGAELRDYGSVSAEDLPLITVRAPRTLEVDRSGAGSIEIGPAQSLELDFSSCGRGTIGDVAGPLNIDLAGSGHISAGAAQTLNADVAGSGELAVGAVAQGANIDIAGSGAVRIASLNGDLSSDGAGSGNLSVDGGAINLANIDLAGSGDVDIAASVRSLNASIVGSGSVDVAGEVGDIEADIAGSGNISARSVTGAIRKEVWGSGDVRVGG